MKASLTYHLATKSMDSLRPLWKVLPYLKPVRRWFWLSVGLALPMAAVRVGPVPLVQHLVDQLLVAKDRTALWFVPLGVVVLFSLNFVIRFFHYYANRVVVIHTNQRIRERMMEHLLSLSSDYFSNEKAGSLASRISLDPAQIDQGVGNFGALLREPITFIALIGYAISINWKLALTVFVIVPFLAVLFSWSGRQLKEKIQRFQELNGEMLSSIGEAIQGIRVIHAFGLEKQVQGVFNRSLDRISSLLKKISKVEEASHPGVEWITSIALALMLYQGGSYVLDGVMTSGQLISFFAAFALAVNPLRTLSDINSKLHSSAGAMIRIQEFLDWKSRIVPSTDAKPLKVIQNDVRFDEVSFQYPKEEREVLNKISFSIPLAKSIALVGPSGSGKTTITQLILRLSDPTSGRILVDGKDLRDLSLADYRSRLALVSQDVFLFHDTVLENIRMGSPNASDEEVNEAARRANAFNFIGRLPKGMHTVVGDRGARLSGGERQRISIARAFLRDPDVLILDEATSNLDTESERGIQETLSTLMKEKTVLVIAHRLSTIQDADEILVLDQGKIVERGTFMTLKNSGGRFQELLAAQWS
jgi:ATP-binding cassette, subfamily B, bacterial MsbA